MIAKRVIRDVAPDHVPCLGLPDHSFEDSMHFLQAGRSQVGCRGRPAADGAALRPRFRRYRRGNAWRARRPAREEMPGTSARWPRPVRLFLSAVLAGATDRRSLRAADATGGVPERVTRPGPAGHALLSTASRRPGCRSRAHDGRARALPGGRGRPAPAAGPCGVTSRPWPAGDHAVMRGGGQQQRPDGGPGCGAAARDSRRSGHSRYQA